MSTDHVTRLRFAAQQNAFAGTHLGAAPGSIGERKSPKNSAWRHVSGSEVRS
jgi:hypothetical protein